MDTERLVRVEESAKQAHKRIDNIENKVENIYELTASVKEIATEMKAMREDVNKIDSRVLAIEEKPAKRRDSIVGTIITRYSNGYTGFSFGKIWIIKGGE